MEAFFKSLEAGDTLIFQGALHLLFRAHIVFILFYTRDGSPTLTKCVRRFERRIGRYIRNLEPELGDGAAPRLVPPEVSFKTWRTL
jgi:hypothetical protein